MLSTEARQVLEGTALTIHMLTAEVRYARDGVYDTRMKIESSIYPLTWYAFSHIADLMC